MASRTISPPPLSLTFTPGSVDFSSVKIGEVYSPTEAEFANFSVYVHQLLAEHCLDFGLLRIGPNCQHRIDNILNNTINIATDNLNESFPLVKTERSFHIRSFPAFLENYKKIKY